MNDEQLEALTSKERLMVKTAEEIDLKGVVQLATALADARLKVAEYREQTGQLLADCEAEVARLTEERDEVVRVAIAENGLRREADAACIEGNKVLDQQREDIRRLIEALSRAVPCPDCGGPLVGDIAYLLADLSAKYPKEGE